MWVCNDGYRRQNNKCTKIKVPSNAHIIGNSWTCNTGFRRKNNTCVAMTAKEKAQMQAYIKKYKQGQLSHQDYVAYKSEVDSEANGVLKLRNGAIIEHTGYSYLGYIGYQEDIVLFGSGRTCKFWINGNVFECDLLRSPPARHGRPASEIYISDVRGNGSILIGGDGALYEVSSLDTITTSLWFGGFDALLIDGDELINFDEDEIVSVSRIR
jgi:hypothetical protein